MAETLDNSEFGYAERFMRAHPELHYDRKLKRWFINGELDGLERVSCMVGDFLREHVPVGSRNRGRIRHRAAVTRAAAWYPFQ